MRFWDSSALVPLLATERSIPFVCADDRLASAAEIEGLAVLR